MSNPTTAAQEEFANLLAKNNSDEASRVHPEDRETAHREPSSDEDSDEEDRYRASQIDAAMRMPTFDRGAGSAGIKLPPASFDAGCMTGVKGVIADARAYENARRNTWKDRVRAARHSLFGLNEASAERQNNDRNNSEPESDGADADEEAFLQQWRESRRRELEAESRNPAVRNRRTSPSVRMYGRLDSVDALGYLDAIEKVGRETVVVVFVYDQECPVSATVESALRSLVSSHPTVHFVKVHYDVIELDNAAVPAILAYRNQGDLFANLTGLIELIPDNEDFDSDSLKRFFRKHGIL